MNLVDNPVYCDFLITPNCNFNCSFCSASADTNIRKPSPMTLSEIEHALVQLEQLDVLRLSFEGGEPFLRKDIFDILSIADRLGFLYYINTNGSLIDDEVALKLSKTNVSRICISIDGPYDYVHDQSRGYPKAFEKVQRAVASLQKHNVPIQAIITLTKQNYQYLYATLKTIKEMGIDSASIMLLAAVGSANRNQIVPFDEWSSLLTLLSIDKKNGRLPVKLKIVSTGESNYPWELYLALKEQGQEELLNVWIKEETIEPFEHNSFGCTSGRTSMAIDSYGNVFGCSLMVSMPELSAGNLLVDSLQDIWQNSLVFCELRNASLEQIEGNCEDCEHLYQCKGGCRACAFSMTGKMLGSDNRCPMKKLTQENNLIGIQRSM
ncbi:radical SAM/SPASM domain-containing protein [Vibrio owensii]|uniref:radical SAM/SPASM domain-containing protein n=1 Tax=Vibrio owensii TaxID=696485 RepID=UPI0018F13269|nr:radical SAM protein [Vibrio owensii]